MNAIHYIGLDVHKKTISYCIKTAAGQIVKEGTLAAERSVLRSWAGSLQQPWHEAMVATIFSACWNPQLAQLHEREMQAVMPIAPPAGGAQTGRVSTGRRQERPAFSGADNTR